MLRSLFIAAVCCLACCSLALAESGDVIFKTYRCAVCHKATGAGKAYPSLEEMARAYAGKQDQMVKYFNGEAEPVMKPEKADTMKPYIEKTKAMTPDERNSLADFILNR